MVIHIPKVTDDESSAKVFLPQFRKKLSTSSFWKKIKNILRNIISYALFLKLFLSKQIAGRLHHLIIYWVSDKEPCPSDHGQGSQVIISTQALERQWCPLPLAPGYCTGAYLALFCHHTSREQCATRAIDLHSCLFSSVLRYVLAAATTFVEQPICETNAGEHLWSQHEIRPWHRTDTKHLT